MADALNERTEGWIAALRLAVISLRDTSDRASFLEHLDNNTARSMNSYLVGEILTQQTQDVQEFLERTSILGQFCAELCAEVLGSDTSREQIQATLDWLEQTNLFLVPLDNRQRWYRYHHLFQELLQQRLQTHCSQEALSTLHLQASAWYGRHDLLEEAIRHALLAGDASRATQLVEAHFFQAFEQEQLTLVEHWLRLLPEDEVKSSPTLLAAQAWIVQARGHLKELPRLLVAAEQLLDSDDQQRSDAHDPHDSLLGMLRGLVASLWSLHSFFTGQVQEGLESARSALAWIPPGEAFMVRHAILYFALSSQASGREEEALFALQQALQDHSTGLSSTARLLLAQTYVYLAMGKLPHVEHLARHLLQIAREDGLMISHHFAHWLSVWLSLDLSGSGALYQGTRDGTHLARIRAGAARSF
jgi:LuxR family maltose regulon positive regulatory protein